MAEEGMRIVLEYDPEDRKIKVTEWIGAWTYPFVKICMMELEKGYRRHRQMERAEGLNKSTAEAGKEASNDRGNEGSGDTESGRDRTEPKREEPAVVGGLLKYFRRGTGEGNPDEGRVDGLDAEDSEK